MALQFVEMTDYKTLWPNPPLANALVFAASTTTAGVLRLEATEASLWPTRITFAEGERADEEDASLEFEFDPQLVPRPRW